MTVQTNKSEQKPENLRSVIDSIALQVTEPGSETDLEDAITDRAAAHIARLLQNGAINNSDVDRVTQAIIRGILKRLEEIAIGGGQIGSA